MDDFELELKKEAVFEIEANLQKIQERFNELGPNFPEGEEINTLFRDFHSLKGNAKSVDFESISQVAHSVEDKLIPIRDGDSPYDQGIHNLIQSFLDVMLDNIDSLKSDLAFEIDFSDIKMQIAKYSIPSSKTEGPVQQVSSGIRCLVVDDEEDIRDLLKDLIQELFNFEVETAGDGLQAIEHCSANRFDFIMTDFNMPNLNGKDLIYRLRNNDGPNASTPIVMLTAFEPAFENDQTTWSDVFFLQKPWRTDKLSFVIKCCLKLQKEKHAS